MSQAGASFVGLVLSSTAGSVEMTSAKDLCSRHADIHMNFLSRILPSSFLLVLMFSIEHGGSPQITEQLPSSPPACIGGGTSLLVLEC